MTWVEKYQKLRTWDGDDLMVVQKQKYVERRKANEADYSQARKAHNSLVWQNVSPQFTCLPWELKWSIGKGGAHWGGTLGRNSGRSTPRRTNVSGGTGREAFFLRP